MGCPPQRVVESDWDYLMVLDACRYDAFEATYDRFFDGTLERRLSKASATPRWLERTFSDEYDLTYVSANPFINSEGEDIGGYGTYTAADHFMEIIDVWKHGWDRDLGTVPPERVTAAALETVESDRDRPVIVHYLQPHGPYLTDPPVFDGDGVDITTPRQFGPV